tara:strand:+ start:3474 stop:4484 length:1011 start_codon:yes stop_codon:yes gene_type:complete
MSKTKNQILIFNEFSTILILSISYWILTGLFDGSGFSTDMSRYYVYFTSLAETLNIDEVLAILQSGQNDPFSYLIQNIFKILGFTFHLFLLSIIYLYFNVSLSRLNNILGKRIYLVQLFTLLIYCLAILSLVNVVLRQGIALLFILTFSLHTERYSLSPRKIITEIFYILMACLLHLSSIIALPFFFIRNLIMKYINTYNRSFYLIYLLYITSAFVNLSSYILALPTADILFLRALSNIESDYIVGPTLVKSIAIILPILSIKLTKKYIQTRQYYQLEPIILFYKYIMIVGMLMSGFPYHDRIFWIGWVFAPLMISIPFYQYFKFLLGPSYIRKPI